MVTCAHSLPFYEALSRGRPDDAVGGVICTVHELDRDAAGADGAPSVANCVC